jgi:hypothetical protein
MSDDIGKLADEVLGRMKTTEELKHVPFEMYARVLSRAALQQISPTPDQGLRR